MKIVDAATVPIAGDRVAFINNTLRSLFSDSDVLINNEIVHLLNTLYAQLAFFQTELSHTQDCATPKLDTQGYSFETVIDDQHDD